MIREPYNLNPYNSTIDITRQPTFNFSFGGDALAQAQVIIAQNNSDGTPLIKSGVSEDTTAYLPGIRNGDNVGLTPDLSYLSNGLDYIWKLRLIEDNTAFHYWCHFSSDHLTSNNIITISQAEYTKYIVTPMLNKNETSLDYTTVSKRLQAYHQFVVYYNTNYYRILEATAYDSTSVQLVLHKALPDTIHQNDKFLLFTNAGADTDLGQYNYATQYVKQGRALSEEVKVSEVLGDGIPYSTSSAYRFESGIFAALCDDGKYYNTKTEQFIIGDNAKIITNSASGITVDIPSITNLAEGMQLGSELTFNGFSHEIIEVNSSTADTTIPEGYYRFICAQSDDSISKDGEIVNYEIRGWNTALEIYKNITTEVVKTAYSYDNMIYAINYGDKLEQRVIAYEQWEYANGDLRGFIYYADFYRNDVTLGIKSNTNFTLKSNFYDSGWFYFQARKTPDVSVVCLDAMLNDKAQYKINSSIASFQGFYSSHGVTTIKTHRWIVSYGQQILYDSGAIYDTDLVLRYENFYTPGEYIVSLEIISQNGVISSNSCNILASDEVEKPSNLKGKGEILSQQQAIKLTWPGLLVTEGKATSGCTINTDVQPPYMHIPLNNYLLFDNIGGGPININNVESDNNKHHFEMRLEINDDLTYYTKNIFVLCNSATGQYSALYKDGIILYWRDQSGEVTPLLNLLDPTFGLQAVQGAKDGNDYQWLAGNAKRVFYWTETSSNTNVRTWDIIMDLSPTSWAISWKAGTISGSKIISTEQNVFDTIYFNGDVNLYWFAYAEGAGQLNQKDNMPAWDTSGTNLIPQIIYKYSNGEFISNPSMDTNTDGMVNPGTIVEYLVYRAYNDGLRTKIGNIKLNSDLIGQASYYFVDWTCINHLKPTYYIVPVTMNDMALRHISIHLDQAPDWDFWTFVGLKQYNSNHYIPDKIWKFYLNLSAGEYSHNTTKTYHQGFSMSPKASIGPINYLTTSLTGLLADLQIVHNDSWDTDYYQIDLADTPKIEKWNEFVSYTDLVLVKDLIGHCFIANLSNNRHSIEDVGQFTTNVSFNITQVDDITTYQIFTSSAQENGYGVL